MRARTTAAVGLLVLTTGASSCSGDRDRPDGDAIGPTGSIQLEAVVLNPQMPDIYYAGGPATITVQASEASGRLLGVGYVIRRVGPDKQILDSTAVAVGPTEDTIIPFHLSIPDTMPHNSQIDVFGIAFGPDTLTALSVPITVVISRCPEGAGFC